MDLNTLPLRYRGERRWLVLEGKTFLYQRDLLVLVDCAFLNISMDYNVFKNTKPDHVDTGVWNPVVFQLFVTVFK